MCEPALWGTSLTCCRKNYRESDNSQFRFQLVVSHLYQSSLAFLHLHFLIFKTYTKNGEQDDSCSLCNAPCPVYRSQSITSPVPASFHMAPRERHTGGRWRNRQGRLQPHRDRGPIGSVLHPGLCPFCCGSLSPCCWGRLYMPDLACQRFYHLLNQSPAKFSLLERLGVTPVSWPTILCSLLCYITNICRRPCCFGDAAGVPRLPQSS